MTTEPPAQQTGDAGEVTSPSPASPYDEFVITDAPLPDHTVTPDDEVSPGNRSSERSAKLLSLTDGMRKKSTRATKEKAERPARTPKRVPPMPRGGLTKQLEQLYVGAGMALLIKDAECGMAVIGAAPKCAETLNALAEKNPAVRRVLLALCNTSALGAVVMAHAPILWAVSKHHVPAVRDASFTALVDGLMSANTTEADAA